MGNKTSRMKTDENTVPGSTKKPQTIISEEDYLPMPRSMRKNILKGRKFHRVLPTRMTPSNNEIDKENVSTKSGGFHEHTISNIKEMNKIYEVSDFVVQNTEMLTNYVQLEKVPQDNSSYKVTPVVTVFSPIEVDDKSKSLPNTQLDERDIAVYLQGSSPRTTHVTNRKYSLIDMRTGLGKSEFTLDLEDKLRKSKGALGFDAHWSLWKEFSYKDSKEDGRGGKSLDSGVEAKLKKIGNTDKPVLKSSNGSVEFRTHNCQILGLCSVGRPQVFPSKRGFEPNIFNNDTGKINTVNKLIKTHSKKDACRCDLCTLAFLTDMNCHGGDTSSVKQKSKNSLPNSDITNRVLKERVQITDNKNGNKSIEISVMSPTPHTQSSLYSDCSNSSLEAKQDCTNSRIRDMFKEHELSEVREIYTNPNSTYKDISIDDPPSKSAQRFDPCSPSRRLVKRTASNNVGQRSLKNKYRKLSSSTMAASLSSTSSLSTVLSYRRVLHIFQTMIEGSRVKKRARVDVLKFKEMEELGLGKFRNNRWCPSEYKTLSIWKDMNKNVQGLQGEFKKYQKTTNKT